MYKYRFWDISHVDIETYNIRKIKPDLKDHWNHSIQGEYFQGIEAAFQYCYDVLTGIRCAGDSEIAMVERFIFDLHRDDLDFNIDEFEIAMTVANELRHPKGPLGGQRFFLMRWMIFIFANVFGFYYNDNARETLRGQRRYLKDVVFVARGNSKTVLSAVVAIVNSIFTANMSPICTTSATTSKQSRIAFGDIAKMITTASSSIKKRFRVLQNEIRVIHNGGVIIPTSKQSESLDGMRITTGVLDEIHAHPSSEIVDVIETGTRSSSDPILFLISTAGVDTQSYGREVFDYSKEVAKQVVPNDRYFAAIYCPNDNDFDNWQDEKVWETANPALGHAVNLEGLRSACEEAKRNAKAAANFKTKHLDIFVDFDEANFIDGNELSECEDKTIDINDYKGRQCYLGLDLAGVSDLSSLVYIFPETNGGVTVFQKSYLPEAAIRDAKPVIKDRYFQAQKDGELIITPTEVTDFEYIKLDIVNAHKDYDVKALSIDGAAGGVRFALELEEEHYIEAVSVKQGFGLSESANMLLNLIKSKKFKYNSKLLEWCFVNSLQVEGAYGDLKVIRSKTDHTKKIDICVATLIGLSQTILEENKYDYENYEPRFLTMF